MRSDKDLYFTRWELSFKRVSQVFKLSSSEPCETRRAYWIPCENPQGKSRDLQWMFLFSFQLSNRTEDFLHFGLYSVSFSFRNTILTIKKLKNTSNKLFLIKEKVWQGKIDHLQFKCMTFVYSKSFIHHFMGLFGTNIITSSQLAW